VRALSGTIDPLPYAILRIAIATTVLLRTTDWLAPIADLDHHAWVDGIEDAPWSEVVLEPRLRAPLVPGLDVLAGGTPAGIAVVLRTALAAFLVTGLFPRATAALLATVGWSIMAADRFRYLHHLHLLWVACALLALAPSGDRLSLRPRSATSSPRWPIQLVRLQALVIYGAAAIAKLRGDWLDGSTIAHLARAGLVDRRLVEAVGAPAIAVAAVAVELALVPLLAIRRTRLAGISLALAFHAVTGATMLLSTFPWTMAVLLVAFAPWRETEGASAADSRTMRPPWPLRTRSSAASSGSERSSSPT
jgi:hypothetical protein